MCAARIFDLFYLFRAHRLFRKLIKTKGGLPADNSLLKLIYWRLFDPPVRHPSQSLEWALIPGILIAIHDGELLGIESSEAHPVSQVALASTPILYAWLFSEFALNP